MIELRNVSKSFGDHAAIRSLSLRIETGRTTVLLGPSGCGKSTLLRLMIGLVEPDQGEILFDGEALRADRLLSLRHHTGYVIQEGGLFPHLTARDNLRLLPRFLGWSPERIQARVQELLELTRFPPDGLDRFPVQLSGGQRQRVGLMRALMPDPRVLLLDEPLGALDPLIRAELQDDLQEIFEKLEKTVVLVTHDLEEAVFFGHQLVLLNEGRIAQQGEFEVFVRQPADPFVTRFLAAQRRSVSQALKGEAS